MKRARELLGEPVELAVRRLALSLLNDAAKARNRLSDPQDADALHAFRVSVRRLRTCLQSYRDHLDKRVSKKLCKRLAELTDATNAGRDAQVHVQWLGRQLARRRLAALARSGIRLMLDELEARQEQTHQKSAQSIADQFPDLADKLCQRLSRGRKAPRLDRDGDALSFAAVTGAILQSHATELQARLAQLSSPDDQEAAHDARLTAKRLRYLIEPLRKELHGGRDVVRHFKQLQDLLGELRDMQTLWDQVDAAVQRAAGDFGRQLLRTAATEPRLSALKRPTPQHRACHALAAVAHLIAAHQRRLFATQIGRAHV